SANRREPRVVTPVRSPCQHLFSTFRAAVCGPAVSGFPSRRSASTHPRAARQHFFSTSFDRLRFRTVPGFPKQSRILYPLAPGPSTLFFKSPGKPFVFRAAFRFPVTRRGVSTPRRRGRQHLFSTSRETVRFPGRVPVSRLAEECFYAPSPGPSTLFFNSPENRPSPGPRPRLPVTWEGASTSPSGNRQHLFFKFRPTPDRRQSVTLCVVRERISKTPPSGCQGLCARNALLAVDMRARLARLLHSPGRTARISPRAASPNLLFRPAGRRGNPPWLRPLGMGPAVGWRRGRSVLLPRRRLETGNFCRPLEKEGGS
ncbi:hypothetical protein DesfrDRAFT_3744, partial [Solidesulfovibrio fructosivorans JJ]]